MRDPRCSRRSRPQELPPFRSLPGGTDPAGGHAVQRHPLRPLGLGHGEPLPDGLRGQVDQCRRQYRSGHDPLRPVARYSGTDRPGEPYVVVTIHRVETIFSSSRMNRIVTFLEEIARAAPGALCPPRTDTQAARAVRPARPPAAKQPDRDDAPAALPEIPGPPCGRRISPSPTAAASRRNATASTSPVSSCGPRRNAWRGWARTRFLPDFPGNDSRTS